MLKKIAIALAALVLTILAIASMRADELRIERSTTIVAGPESTFERINDFHRWAEWSPYEEKDPDMKRTFDGAASGKGAVYTWQGDGDVGAGRMEILESSAPEKVRIQLDFSEPFAGHNIAEFALVSRAGVTNVSWSMSGRNNLLAKVIGLVIDIDEMVGRDFERGLANLKTLAEGGEKKALPN